MTAQQQDAFPHPSEAAGPWRCPGDFRIETAASIFDVQAQHVRGRPDPHGHFTHARMAGDVRQRFLHDPVGRRFHLGRKAFFDSFVLEVDQHPGLAYITLEEREQSGQESELIQRGRSQVER